MQWACLQQEKSRLRGVSLQMRPSQAPPEPSKTLLALVVQV